MTGGPQSEDRVHLNEVVLSSSDVASIEGWPSSNLILASGSGHRVVGVKIEIRVLLDDFEAIKVFAKLQYGLISVGASECPCSHHAIFCVAEVNEFSVN